MRRRSAPSLGFSRERDHAGELAALFAGDPALTPAQRDRVESEEAWTLGVTAARQRPIPIPPDVTGQPSAAAISPLRPRGRRGTGGREKSGGSAPAPYPYLRDPKAISRTSFALVRAEAELARFPPPLRRVAARIAHAAGDVTILEDLAWSAKPVAAGHAALAAGAPIIVDSAMVAAGIIRERLTAGNEVLCLLRDPAVSPLAAAQRTTRSAAAVELWRPHLAGAVVAIGNAPTALFRLLEILAEGAAKPALILGFPVGFVGAVEAKTALAGFGRGVEFITLHGRRGGSAIAAAAVNALASRR